MKDMETKAEEILGEFSSNHWLASQLMSGVNDEESLLQPPFPANCMNWVVGHLVSGRCTALFLLGAEPVWEEAATARYRTGSDPVVDARDSLLFSRLVEDFNETQLRLEQSLKTISPTLLENVAETNRGVKTIQEHLQGLAWHETFHIGQLDFLASFIVFERDTHRIVS